jgi:hypothetical protein
MLASDVSSSYHFKSNNLNVAGFVGVAMQRAFYVADIFGLYIFQTLKIEKA